MPEIKRFAGFKIVMYFGDENPPHVHLIGPGYAAKIRLSDGAVMAGKLPANVARRARAWIASHRDELSEKWTLLKG